MRSLCPERGAISGLRPPIRFGAASEYQWAGIRRRTAELVVAVLTFVDLGSSSCTARPGHTSWHFPDLSGGGGLHPQLKQHQTCLPGAGWSDRAGLGRCLYARRHLPSGRRPRNETDQGSRSLMCSRSGGEWLRPPMAAGVEHQAATAEQSLMASALARLSATETKS